ncbi:hypothetical protein EEB14_38240 [Rhodococcus sp. WS4]|nr:hypothetical protein EEB14_38240 [Rhodococcus sp. WS4]
MTADTGVDCVAREEYAHTIDLDDDRAAGQRYELGFRYTCRDGLLIRWSVQLVVRCSVSGHTETVFARGGSPLEPTPNGSRNAAVNRTDFDAATEFFEAQWRTLLDLPRGTVRTVDDQRHHTDALTLYGRTWRSVAGHEVADGLASFAEVTVLALATDPALQVMRRAAAHHPEPVILALYHPVELRIDLVLVDTATMEALIDDPGPLRAGPDSSAGALFTGPHSVELLHPGYLRSLPLLS